MSLLAQIESLLVRTSPNLAADSTALAAHAQAIAASGAYAPTVNGLQPVNSSAIRLLASQGIPAAFISAAALEAAARIENPLQRTIATFEFQGSSFDAAMTDEQDRASRGSL